MTGRASSPRWWAASRAHSSGRRWSPLLSTEALTWFFATAILVAVAISASGVHVAPTRANLFGGGLASGFTATSIAVGGPPMALVLQSSEGPVVRRTLARFFAVGVGFSFAALALFGEMDTSDIGRGLALVPGTAIGLLLSGRLARFLDRGYTRTAVPLPLGSGRRRRPHPRRPLTRTPNS